MAFVKKIWKDRQSEYPNRRKLLATGAENEYEITRSEGTVMEEGDLLNAPNLNDLEERIKTAVDSVLTAVSAAADSAKSANDKINELSTDITAIKYVTSLPANPDANTLYLIKK